MYLGLATELSSMSHPGGTCFEGMKGSLRASKAWHCVEVFEETPGEAFSESIAQLPQKTVAF